MLPRSHIMVHHSLTKDGETVSFGAIERFHVEENHWLDVGYHFGVEETGAAAVLGRYRYQALVGRALDQVASACPQGEMNRAAIHVCCVGNYDLVAPPEELLQCLARRVLRPMMRQFGIPAARIVGHRDYNPAKSCPGKLFDLDRVRRMVA